MKPVYSSINNQQIVFRDKPTIAKLLISTNPENWPEQDELPQPDISDLEETYRATVDEDES